MSTRTRPIVAACCLSLLLCLPLAAQTARRGTAGKRSLPSISYLLNHVSNTVAELLHRLTVTFAQDGTGVPPPPPTTNGGPFGGGCDGAGGVDPWGCPSR